MNLFGLQSPNKLTMFEDERYDENEQRERDREYWSSKYTDFDWSDRREMDDLLKWDEKRSRNNLRLHNEIEESGLSPKSIAKLIYETQGVPLRPVDNPDLFEGAVEIYEQNNVIKAKFNKNDFARYYKNKDTWEVPNNAKGKGWYKEFQNEVQRGRVEYEKSFRSLTEKHAGLKLQPQTQKEISRGASEKRAIEISEKEAKLTRDNRALLDTQKRLNLEINTLKRSLDNAEKQAL